MPGCCPSFFHNCDYGKNDNPSLGLLGVTQTKREIQGKQCLDAHNSFKALMDFYTVSKVKTTLLLTRQSCRENLIIVF